MNLKIPELFKPEVFKSLESLQSKTQDAHHAQPLVCVSELIFGSSSDAGEVRVEGDAGSHRVRLQSNPVFPKARDRKNDCFKIYASNKSPRGRAVH